MLKVPKTIKGSKPYIEENQKGFIEITKDLIKNNSEALRERWNDFYYNDEQVKIQRDLYSAFLIMNVNNNLKSIDRDKCIKTFNNFKEFHDKEIERIKLDKNNKRIIKSMGI